MEDLKELIAVIQNDDFNRAFTEDPNRFAAIMTVLQSEVSQDLLSDYDVQNFLYRIYPLSQKSLPKVVGLKLYAENIDVDIKENIFYGSKDIEDTLKQLRIDEQIGKLEREKWEYKQYRNVEHQIARIQDEIAELEKKNEMAENKCAELEKYLEEKPKSFMSDIVLHLNKKLAENGTR